MAQRYPKEFKEQVLLEVKEIGNVAQVAKRHNVSNKSIYRWIAEAQHKDWQETPGTAKQIEAYVPYSRNRDVLSALIVTNNTFRPSVKVTIMLANRTYWCNIA